jgi:hypothetical protein
LEFTLVSISRSDHLTSLTVPECSRLNLNALALTGEHSDF